MAARRSPRTGVHVGVGGWSFAPWRGTFYPDPLPQSAELSHMAGRLNSVEINSTFYGLQKPATFRRWRDATPEGFVFAVKAPRFVTYRGDLAAAAGSVEKFLDSGVTELAAKLGPINWQLPPRKRFDAAEMEGFLQSLPPRHGRLALRHAIEVRDASFATATFVQLARRHGIAIVIAGDSPWPQIANPTARFAYLRIMGTQERLRAGYAASRLELWARRARALATGRPADGLESVPESRPPAARPREVHLYVISGAKRRNPAAAMALLQRLRA